MNNTEFVNAILAARNASTAAYEHVLEEVQALDPSKVRPMNVDAPTCISRALSGIPRILALRAEIVKHLPTVDIGKLQKLEDYAHALQEAHVRCLSAGKSPDELRALGEEGDSLRAVLRSDAAALVHRGLIDPARLSSCDGQPGYKTIATELGVLASVMTSCWPQIQGKSCVTEQELHRAQAIAEALLAFVGIREQPPEKRAAAIDIRDRAFTLLVDNYDVARRAITFLRWNDGDADLVAPSLYGGKRRANTKADDQEEEVSSTANPATTPGASAVTMPAPTPTATPTPGNGSANPSSAGVSVGRPNSNPFVQ